MINRAGYVTLIGVLALVTAASLSPTGSAAAVEKYKIDTVHSSVLFRIKHLDVGYIFGRFRKITGNVTFDAKDPSSCALEVSVPVASIDTNDSKRDRHLKSPDFFNAKQYKKIAFKSTGFKKAGTDTYEVTGDLTLHGETRSITIALERTGAGPDPWGGYRIGFMTTFTIKRSDFGMGGMRQMLGDEVQLIISFEAVRQ